MIIHFYSVPFKIYDFIEIYVHHFEVIATIKVIGRSCHLEAHILHIFKHFDKCIEVFEYIFFVFFSFCLGSLECFSILGKILQPIRFRLKTT